MATGILDRTLMIPLSTEQRTDGTELLNLGFEAVAWRNGDRRRSA